VPEAAVDLVARSTLGHRDDEHVVAGLGHRDTGEEPALDHGVDDACGRAWKPDRELLEARPAGERPGNARQGCDRLGRIRGFRRALAPDVGKAVGPEPGQVDRRRDRHQRLVGADVGVRLVAADVLFSGLQGEHVARAALDVDRLPHDATGKLAHIGHARGDDAEVGTTVVQVVPEHLTLPHSDVGAQLAR
jgi:hypothetical protein